MQQKKNAFKKAAPNRCGKLLVLHRDVCRACSHFQNQNSKSQPRELPISHCDSKCEIGNFRENVKKSVKQATFLGKITKLSFSSCKQGAFLHPCIFSELCQIRPLQTLASPINRVWILKLGVSAANLYITSNFPQWFGAAFLNVFFFFLRFCTLNFLRIVLFTKRMEYH